MTNRIFKKISAKLRRILPTALTILISVITISAIVKAGTITPPSGTPSAKFYTLSEIYNLINSNSTTTEGSHSFTFSDSLAGSGRTLTEIYNALSGLIDASKVLSGTTYLGIAGTMASNGAFGLTSSSTDQSITAGYYSGGTLAGDADLISANIKSGADIFGVAGDSNVVDTSSGNATSGNILLGKIAWVDGTSTTGTMADNNSFALTCSASDQSVTAGYYSGGTLAGDSDLTAGKIMADVNIFGVTGTLLKNLYSGSAGPNVSDYATYTQALGGVDDYNDNGTIPGDAYTGSWTDCVAPGYCGAYDSNADAKDNSTGLIWSNRATSTTQTWFWADNCYATGTAENPGDCVNDGDDACQCVKKATNMTGCEALGSGWRLPYQKELMQAYINGSWANLSNAGHYYWSATTRSFNTQYAWYVGLNNGSTSTNLKTNSGSYYVRCVR